MAMRRGASVGTAAWHASECVREALGQGSPKTRPREPWVAKTRKSPAGSQPARGNRPARLPDPPCPLVHPVAPVLHRWGGGPLEQFKQGWLFLIRLHLQDCRSSNPEALPARRLPYSGAALSSCDAPG